MIKWNAPLSLSGVHSQRVLCDKFVDKLRNEFICSWLGRLHDDTKGTCSQQHKLRTYRMFKIRYEMEPYLCFLNNPQYRHYLARFRCSAHKLLVETGRYIGLEFNQRICPHCMEDVETEMHFACSCPMYNSLRKNMYDTVCKSNAEFSMLSERDNFYFFNDLSGKRYCVLLSQVYLYVC